MLNEGRRGWELPVMTWASVLPMPLIMCADTGQQMAGILNWPKLRDGYAEHHLPQRRRDDHHDQGGGGE